MDEVVAEVVEERVPEIKWPERVLIVREGGAFKAHTHAPDIDMMAKWAKDGGIPYRILRVQPPSPPKPTDRGQWDVFGAPPSDTWETMRESCHATFNGGHHDPKCREAFHHGMDTVFNCLSGGGFKGMAECRRGAELPPKKQRVVVDWPAVCVEGYGFSMKQMESIERHARIVDEEAQP